MVYLYNDLPEKCKCCEYKKAFGLRMDGNHQCVCMNHSPKKGIGFKGDCPCFKRYEEYESAEEY